MRATSLAPSLESSNSSDLVRTYLQEIGKFELLTQEEEISYGKQVQAMMNLVEAKELLTKGLGREPTQEEWATALRIDQKELEGVLLLGRNAMKKMIECNLRLVVTIAKKYQHRNMELLDLVQEGTLGLKRGIEKFDPMKGYRLSTYIYWWIRQAITRAIPEKSRTIRLPLHMIEKLNKLKKARRQLTQKLGHTPTIKELANEMNIEPKMVQYYLTLILARTTSLDMKVNENTETELYEVLPSKLISPEAYVDEQILCEEVRGLMAGLSQRQQEVINLRHGLTDGKERSLHEVGKALGVSRERARQLYQLATQKLKQAIENKRGYAES
jgi:RNA polymerase nonessential primary-like sigma factor